MNIIFENDSPKGTFWANKKKVEFLLLSPDYRKLLTTSLNKHISKVCFVRIQLRGYCNTKRIQRIRFLWFRLRETRSYKIDESVWYNYVYSIYAKWNLFIKSLFKLLINLLQSLTIPYTKATFEQLLDFGATFEQLLEFWSNFWETCGQPWGGEGGGNIRAMHHCKQGFSNRVV